MPSETHLEKARELLGPTGDPEFANRIAEALDEAAGIEPVVLRDWKSEVADFVKARDNGDLLPWEELGRGFGTRTFGRSLRGHEDESVMVVRGKRYAVGWTIVGIKNPSLVYAAGVFRADAADINYELAMKLADEALARLDPNDPATYTAIPPDDDDRSLLYHQDLLNTEDTVLWEPE